MAAAADCQRELTEEVMRWRAAAEGHEASLREQMALNQHLSHTSEERVAAVQQATSTA